MKLLKLIPLLALLSACASAPQAPVVPDVPVVQPKTQIVIPTELTMPCPPLKKLTQTSYSQGASVDALKVWFDQYDTCASRFSKFVTVVAPALNIKELGTVAPSEDQNPATGSK